MRKVLLSLISACLLVNSYAVTKHTDKDILQKTAEKVDWLSIRGPEYPSYSDRTFWNGLPENWKEKYIKAGEKYLDYNWPSVKATSYLRFMQDGDRNSMQSINGQRTKALYSLMLAELVEGEGRFLNCVIDGVFAICEQTSWCLSAHLYMQKSEGSLPNVTEPIIDLGAVNTGESMALIHYFFNKEFDKVNPLISQRIEYEIEQRILKPYYERDDFWWMGFTTDFVNNWNVWCNANVLKCIWLIEDDEQLRTAGIEKVIRSADKFVNYYNEDGACEEGPQYWGHAGGKLYELIETLNAMSGGQFRPYTNQKVKNIAKYISAAHIDGNYFVNFADASPFIGSYPGLIYRIGKMIEDEELELFAKELAIANQWEQRAPHGELSRVIEDLMLGTQWLKGSSKNQAELSHFFEQTGMCVARDAKNKADGFFFAAKGGHNNESHNHNDVGTFILYHNGSPILADAGVGTYTKKTFSPRRYEIWNMQSENHNLPIINGMGQAHGQEYRSENVSFNDDGKTVSFSLNIEKAYPIQANVSKWKREYTYLRAEGLTISDDYVLKKSVQQTEYRFITPLNVVQVAPGKLLLESNNENLYLYYDSSALEWHLHSINDMDERLSQNWPNGLNRLVFKQKEQAVIGSNHFRVAY